MVADYLSFLVFDNNNNNKLPIKDSFFNEQLISIKTIPWCANIIKFLVVGEMPDHWSAKISKDFYRRYAVFSTMISTYSNIIWIKLLGLYACR